MRVYVYGQYESMMIELCREHHCDFKFFLRMDPQMFHDLLQRVGPSIEKSPEQVLFEPDSPCQQPKTRHYPTFPGDREQLPILEIAFWAGACSAARRVPGSEVTASLRRISPNGARSDFNSELKSIRRPRGAKNRPAAVVKPAGLRPGPVRDAPGSSLDPARDLTATRPNCKSRSEPYRKPHGPRRRLIGHRTRP
ncbi:hypothetical protein Bbelb_027410 [Branchiostoma belcheri]|nr:hypothetical protein Bbelb_027410 [Branchiostoma belcheri]